MIDPKSNQGAGMPGHYGNWGQRRSVKPTGQDRQEQYQRTRQQPPADRNSKAPSGHPESNPTDKLVEG